MSDPLVSIILRSYNEAWALKDTLPAIRGQEYKNWELIVIDSGSTDGSEELLRNFKPRILKQIQSHEYNPSRVMNWGMQMARSPFGIFLNADATPQNEHWLRPLVAALDNPQTAAVFGCQMPRQDCQAVYACDYERCFGANRESVHWDHFFSMVSSGIRKDIWCKRGFLENLQYAEDDEYTRWAKTQGYNIEYVPRSVVMHSHNYTPEQVYKRNFGDSRALAASWQQDPAYFSFWRTVALGWVNDFRHDLKFCARHKRWNELPHAAKIRWHQRLGKLDGFRQGWRDYREDAYEDSCYQQSVPTALRGRI
jgi:rhamnosyltransferase